MSEADRHAEAWITFGLLLLIVAASLTAFYIVRPTREWDQYELSDFERRAERLILTGSSSIVVDVLSESFPKDAPLRISEDHTTQTRYRLAYESLLDIALIHDEFLRAAAVQDRGFLSKLLSHHSRSGMFYSDRVLNELMFGQDQMLPRELIQCTNFDRAESKHYFEIPDNCHVLHELFDNTLIADLIAAWKPIGEGLLKHLSRIRQVDEFDIDQLPFFDGERPDHDPAWDSPLGPCIYYFRIMATSALVQQTRSNMWIMYLRHFVKAICEIVTIPAQTRENEYPNRYCFWIKDCIDCCRDVVNAVEHLSKNDPNYRVQNDPPHVLASTLSTLGRCLLIVFDCNSLEVKFKSECADMLCSGYENWHYPGFPPDLPDYALRMLTDSLYPDERTRFAKQIEDLVDNDLCREKYRELVQILQDQANP